MDVLAMLKLVPVVVTVVEGIKRFIPNKQRAVINPILALITGCVGAYTMGGVEGLLDILIYGVTAGVTAIGAYKIPKVIGNKLGTN